MRRTALRAARLLVALAIMAGASLSADPPPDPLCPFCLPDYKCCIRGNHATCIPASQPC